MKSRTKLLLSLFLGLIMIFQSSAVGAYSYGKPDQEDIGEVYKLVYAELNKNTPDWAKMATEFAKVKAEIANPHHYGPVSPQIAAYIETKIANKDKSGLIENYKALMVLNIERRLAFTGKSFSDYPTAKLILAKGYATFRDLRPTITDAIPAGTLAELDKDFHTMVDDAIGNPGLFGVGKKEPNKALYDSLQNKIVNTLKPKFPLSLNQSPSSTGLVLTIDQTRATINGKASTLDAAPYIKSGRTFVPIRFISEGLGAKVTWDDKSKTVTITEGTKTIRLTINSTTAVSNGKQVKLDAPAEIRNGRTFVPVRVISEVLGYKVDWNAAAKRVTIQ
ncbi:copper amine oxidase N-terminal domain-containing protein [Ammoniphilus sp. YIM 78166]|uniref:copper amine oxidase N-terminal domain-containing protein n=1 Tax=Ammoniphilus sp. YIM 78166 TaxID=1644106 RepID=UPI00106FEA8A|nr:copper amine oxidase N-terminal domain-containing protein [Ammoniphilus sp. YIM 78166]